MIGNDVVDLRDSETQPGATHARFDRRVFAASEREALGEVAEPNRLRWCLWAAKEAAYKVARKMDAAAVWAPLRFIVSIDEGVVRHEARTFRVRIEAGDGFVHAVAWDDSPSRLSGVASAVAMPPPPRRGRSRARHGIGMVDELAPSVAVRGLARAAIAAALGADAGEVEILRRGRIPYVAVRGEAAGVDLSLSHHGRFVAWAFAEVAAP